MVFNCVICIDVIFIDKKNKECISIRDASL